MQIAPTTHFVSLAQAILYRGAGIDVVWPQCAILVVIGAVFFGITLVRFRKTIGILGEEGQAHGCGPCEKVSSGN
jgi:ABC-2 type transport system permease protein